MMMMMRKRLLFGTTAARRVLLKEDAAVVNNSGLGTVSSKRDHDHFEHGKNSAKLWEDENNDHSKDNASHSNDTSNVGKKTAPPGLPPGRSVKRFWKSVEVKPSTILPGEFCITLDNKFIKTPKASQLAVPSKSLAHAIALEWTSQGTYLLPYTMPLMTLATTAIDRVPSIRHEIIDNLMNFLPTDLTLCRSPDPPRLYKLMEDQWGPVIKKVENEFGVKFNPTVTLNGAIHSEKDVKITRDFISSLSQWNLGALDALVNDLKSLVLGLAVYGSHISAEEACKLARLEENVQAEGWGEVEGAHDVDLLTLQVHVASASVFKKLINQ